MVDHTEHWKQKWIEWWTKWPDGKFPGGTHACKAKSDIKTGKATIDHMAGQFAAAEFIEERKAREKAEN